jgi:hypothetical protein
MMAGPSAGFARATGFLGEVRKGAVEAPSEEEQRSDHGTLRGPIC